MGPTSEGKPSPASAASLKIWTSTPAENTSPSARQTAARTSEPSTSATHSSSSWKASALKKLRSPFESVMTPTSPSLSYVIAAISPLL